MTINNVPNILLKKVEKVNFIYYENAHPNEKNKVLFSQNVISFVIEGEKEIYFPNNTVKFQDSIALIRASNCLMSERKTNKDKPYKALLIFFDNSLLTDIKIKYENELNINNVRHSQVNVIENDEFLTIYRKHIVQILSLNDNILTQRVKELKLEELLLYLLRRYPNELYSFLKPQIDENIVHFKSVIEHNRVKNLTIDELAFLCNMSVSTFKRHFNKYYNSSPQKWFFLQRMNYAKKMIEQGKRPSEIYRNAGYTSLSNFIKAYKKHFGNTPKKQNLNF